MLQNSTTYLIPVKVIQFLNYSFVGFLAACAHFTSLYLLVDVFQLLSPVKASLVAFACGSCVGFIGKRSFVFKQSNAKWAALYKYLLLVAFSGAVNTIVMYYLTTFWSWNYLICQLIATGGIFMSNFMICKIWIFKEHKDVAVFAN